jgi:peptidase M28-like protein
MSISSTLKRVLLSSRPSGKLIILSVFAALVSLYSRGVFAQTQPTVAFTQVSRETIESRLRRFARSNDKREANLRTMFMEVGCDGEHLIEQPIKGRKQQNLICSLQGSTDNIFIVGAHFDHVEEYGEGVVDNWSGASLLPSLFESLKSHILKHTVRFIGFAEEEKGLIGSDFYAKQLKPDEIEKVRVMIDLDSLGLGPTKIWRTHSDPKMVRVLGAVANAMSLPVDVLNADQVADEDSTPFRKRHIPTLMLHSITEQTFSILHSPNDKFARIQLSDYYDSYRLIAVYLAYLDGFLD